MTPLDVFRRLRRRGSARTADRVAAALPPLRTPAEPVPLMPAARIIQTRRPQPPSPPASGRAPAGAGRCGQCQEHHPHGVARRWNPFSGWHTWTSPTGTTETERDAR